MATDSKQNLKQLRVDNWAVFFLQRLQLLFAKGDCCDLTLKFVSGQELKVGYRKLSQILKGKPVPFYGMAWWT